MFCIVIPQVKDTRTLLRLADAEGAYNLPEKTILMKKKPRQSWQCSVSRGRKRRDAVVLPINFNKIILCKFLSHLLLLPAELSQHLQSSDGSYKAPA